MILVRVNSSEPMQPPANHKPTPRNFTTTTLVDRYVTITVIAPELYWGLDPDSTDLPGLKLAGAGPAAKGGIVEIVQLTGNDTGIRYTVSAEMEGAAVCYRWVAVILLTAIAILVFVEEMWLLLLYSCLWWFPVFTITHNDAGAAAVTGNIYTVSVQLERAAAVCDGTGVPDRRCDAEEMCRLLLLCVCVPLAVAFLYVGPRWGNQMCLSQ